jgi:hypothetical protein
MAYNAHPRIYQTLFTLVKQYLKHKVTISFEDLKRDMRQVYHQNTNSTFSHGKNKELSLSAVHGRGKPLFKKVFKGDCRICVKKDTKLLNFGNQIKNRDKHPSNYKFTPAGISDKSDDKKKLHCTYCNKDGHTMDRCFRKKQNEEKDDKQDNADLVMIAIDGLEGQNFHRERSFIHKVDNDHDKAHLRDKYNMSPNTFIFDSGATSHMMYSKEGLTNLKPWHVLVKVGNASNIYSEMKGTYYGLVTHEGGRTVRIILEDVLYIPGLYINLFSITKVLNNPSIDLKKDKRNVALIINKDKKILFDKTIPFCKRMLLGADTPPLIENLHTAVVDYQALHERLEHANDKKVAATAKKLGIKYTGQPHPCEHCAQAKLRIKNILKVTTHVVATDIGERIMFDISSVQVPSMGGNQFG